MPIVESYAPGTFCWVELGTTDPNVVKPFYAGLFGWTAVDMPMGPETYTLMRIEDRDVAGGYKIDPERMPGVPPHWMLYVAVADADQAAAKASELGATMLMAPFDVPGVGRMAVIKDPTGAVISLFQAGDHKGMGLAGVPGTMCWGEVATREAGKAGEFYSGLFGWTLKPSGGPYTEIMSDGRPIGGILQMGAEFPPHIPAHWMPYFLVENCDASAEKAKELGGTVCVPPTDIPNTGRFSVLNDPTGAFLSIFQSKMG